MAVFGFSITVFTKDPIGFLDVQVHYIHRHLQQGLERLGQVRDKGFLC